MLSNGMYYAVEDSYADGIPDYILTCGKTYVTLLINGVLQGPHKVRVTIGDIVEYYVSQARSMSTMRALAGEYGDWRMIDNLAKEVLEYFKLVNVDELRRQARARGIEPRF